RRRALERRVVALATGAGGVVDHLDRGRHRRDAARQAPRLARGLVRRRRADGRGAGEAAARRPPVHARPAGDHRRARRRRAAGRDRLLRAGAAAHAGTSRRTGVMRHARVVVFCLCAVVADAAGAADADGYAYAWPVRTQGDGAAWQVELTPEVYA